ncbi:hypothetical protein H5P28_07360 [Ruficoccus amylovorans]|uniref:Uncharacterized protein n=1 Tax=Ruficoccus amylovorans TaxID=1804625 RepID=A0A842HDF0_9BACT|nr:hypothetical protein [Ruficoccus amylovorans]MBC2594078.1 hypothetical protein [Ruficoccus amylovorans]
MQHPATSYPAPRPPVCSLLSLIMLGLAPLIAHGLSYLLKEQRMHTLEIAIYMIFAFGIFNLASLVFAIVSCVRRERWAPFSWTVLVLNFLPGLWLFGVLATNL